MRTAISALLLASSLLPVTALAAPPASADVHASTAHISTGVANPVVLNAGNFSISNEALQSAAVNTAAVVLSLHVNEKGAPSDVRVVHSASPKLDAEVVAAARAFHFRPAMLDHEPVPVDLRLEVVVQR